MNEIKGLLWYILSSTTMIVAFILLKFNYIFSILLMIFACLDMIIGFLYYFGIMDKINMRRKK